jgi:hypothetical protein
MLTALDCFGISVFTAAVVDMVNVFMSGEKTKSLNRCGVGPTRSGD